MVHTVLETPAALWHYIEGFFFAPFFFYRLLFILCSSPADPWHRLFDRWPLQTPLNVLAGYPDEATQQDAGRKRVLLDATPGYLASPIAPARVQQLVPNARFVVVLRVRTSFCFNTSVAGPKPLSLPGVVREKKRRNKHNKRTGKGKQEWAAAPTAASSRELVRHVNLAFKMHLRCAVDVALNVCLPLHRAAVCHVVHIPQPRSTPHSH